MNSNFQLDTLANEFLTLIEIALAEDQARVEGVSTDFYT